MNGASGHICEHCRHRFSIFTTSSTLFRNPGALAVSMASSNGPNLSARLPCSSSCFLCTSSMADNRVFFGALLRRGVLLGVMVFRCFLSVEVGGTDISSMTSLVSDSFLGFDKGAFFEMGFAASFRLPWNILSASLTAGLCHPGFMLSAFSNRPLRHVYFSLDSMSLQTSKAFFMGATKWFCPVDAYSNQCFFLSRESYLKRRMLLRINCSLCVMLRLDIAASHS